MIHIITFRIINTGKLPLYIVGFVDAMRRVKVEIYCLLFVYEFLIINLAAMDL